MARSGGSRRRGRRQRGGQAGAQGRAGAPLTPRPTRADAPRPDEAEGAASEPVEASPAGASPAGAGTLPARPRRQIQSERPTTEDTPRVRSLWYRLTHPRAIMAIIDELRKVVWPTRQETANLTVVVLVVAIAVGVFLGAIDFGLNRVVENVLLP